MAAIVGEAAAAFGIASAEALHAVTDAYLAQLDTPAAGRQEAARYVEALILLEAYDRPVMASNLGNVLFGAKAGKVSREAVESARRTIADVSVSLQVSALNSWTADMPEYQAGLKLLLEEAVEEARRRVEDRVARLVAARQGVLRRTTPNSNGDKKREYVPLRAFGRLSSSNAPNAPSPPSSRRQLAKDAGVELESLEAAMAAFAEVGGAARPAPFNAEARSKIFKAEFPWGASVTGVRANKAELLQRFHRARSTLDRIAEENVLLRVEAERGVIYFEMCVVAIEEAISEFEAPAERPTDPSPAWARAASERAGRAFLLRRHLDTYKDLVRRARSRWSAWAPNVMPPVAGTGGAAGGTAADDAGAGADTGASGGDAGSS